MSVNVFIYVWFQSAWIFAAFTNKMYISLGCYCWLVLLLFFPFALFRFFSFISQPKRKTHTLEYKRIAKYVYWIFNGIQIGIDTWNEFRRFTTSIFQFGFVYPVLCHKCRTVKYQKKKKINKTEIRKTVNGRNEQSRYTRNEILRMLLQHRYPWVIRNKQKFPIEFSQSFV